MGKSVRFYLDDELEAIIEKVLLYTDEFETEASLIRLSTKRYLKNSFPELLLKKFEDEKN